jgi:hypothetical protein
MGTTVFQWPNNAVGGMRIRPANQAMALSVTAIVTVLAFRIVSGTQNCLFVRQRDPTIWDSPSTGMSWLLWLTLAVMFGLLYCVRASLAALRSRPLLPHTGAVLTVAWAFALVPVLALVAAFAECRWLAWAVWLW